MARRNRAERASRHASRPRPRRKSSAKRIKQPTSPFASKDDATATFDVVDHERPDPTVPTVVGVGASAGGLEAFSQLLEALPADADVAVVFVQHLSPQHESALPMLLASKSLMPIVQVTEGLEILPRHVYVIPPNVQMGISDGVLHLLPRPYDRSQFTPIDFFFLSLARWAQNRAIGVILSGTASDGTAGIREIKAAGGITMAQTPATAKYDGMPRSAIATGLIDLVLAPHEIAEQIAHIPTHPYHGQPAIVRGDQDQEIAPREGQLGEIFKLLRRVSGTDFRQYKTPTVKRRLLRRMALHRLTDINAYILHLREDANELSALYQDLLIHVTRFFRDPDSFAVLATEVFPEFVDGRSEDESIRIWVPGCATGEEAYSVAITLMEVLGDRASGRRLQIFATDVSESAIEHARAGVYAASISADVSPERLRRFFTKADGGYKINKTLRDACVFARHDLTRDPPFSRLDLIVCRNVLIYLDAKLQQRLMSIFHYALRSRGFLMLGAAETTGNHSLFSDVDKRWRLYRKAAVDMALPVNFAAVEPFPRIAAPASTREPFRGERRSVQEEASRLLLRYSPASVVVDEKLQIVQFRGQTGPFLEPAAGDPNLNLLKMAREGLLFSLRSAVQMARRKQRTVRKEGVLVRRDGHWHSLNLEVVPLVSSGAGHLLVVFEETSAQTPQRRDRTRDRKNRIAPTQSRETDERLAGLTRELAASREYLQSIIQELEAANEELQSANEEILSSNEELQSTNEELDTAKEELQSSNEELNTLNEELHSRNDELSRVNSDLMNLLATVDITILIVGDDMRIRRFTPTAERVLNLIPGDVGRPVGQINTNLVAENLEALTRETIETMMPRERDVQDRQGKWYSLRIRPYKNVDNRIDGAVLTLMDIGAVKQYQEQLERSQSHVLETVELMQEPVMVLNEDLQVAAANQAFYRTFGLRQEDTVGMPLFDVANKEWNIPRLRTLLQQLLSADNGIENVTIDHQSQSHGLQRLAVNGRRISLGDAKYWAVLALSVVHAEGQS
jgi:two-component system, chemotaxis family, CheB/CheR fusion protein